MKTLLLDQTAWDLVLDASGNIALADEPYALAQDVASAVRTFAGEVYYNTVLGVPYFEQVLGYLPPASVLAQLMDNAALTVPDVISPETSLQSFNRRGVAGQIQFTDPTGVAHSVVF